MICHVSLLLNLITKLSYLLGVRVLKTSNEITEACVDFTPNAR